MSLKLVDSAEFEATAHTILDPVFSGYGAQVSMTKTDSGWSVVVSVPDRNVDQQMVVKVDPHGRSDVNDIYFVGRHMLRSLRQDLAQPTDV
jgi:hypothetical protein